MKKNVQDYQEFIKKHKSLTNTETYWKFREQGGKIKKQTAQGIFRDYTGQEKYKERNKTVKILLYEKKEKSIFSGDIKKKVFRDTESPAIEKVYDNIKKLYSLDDDTEQTKFLKIGMQNRNDEFSKRVNFNLFIPTDSEKMSTKKLGNSIIKNMSTYYKNLSKLYSSMKDMNAKTQEAIQQTKNDLRGKNLTKNQMSRIFDNNGFSLSKYELFEFTEN